MSLNSQVGSARSAQEILASRPRAEREALLTRYAEALKAQRAELIATLAEDAKKTLKDAAPEVDGSANIILQTIKEATLPELNDMLRERMREPVGIVGLITSFNFPLVVAHWNIAPAILAGNAVLWKPSEKTPAAAHAAKKIWDSIAGEFSDALQIISGDRKLGAELVAHEDVDMISATGSVAMGDAIKATLAKKKNNAVPPILELGGNNAVVIGEHMNEAHLEFAVNAVLSSFLGTTGQRCTNTRRLIVHSSWFDAAVSLFEEKISEFVAGSMRDRENIYGYNMLIDDDAQSRFDAAKAQAQKEGGKILFGGKGEPAIAVMPLQTDIMHTETFAPLLYITHYVSGIGSAMALVNAPDNAGLVNGIYTLSKAEADEFARTNKAGHSVINSPRGTGTPANGMGFGGNKVSGVGEILWSGDPLAAFTRKDTVRRVATNKNIPLV